MTALAFLVAVIALFVAMAASRRANELATQIRELRAMRVAPAPRPEAAPELEPAPAVIAAPEEPPIAVYVPPKPTTARARAWTIDWENLVGIKLFSWIAGIALVLSAVFLFKYSVEHGWLRPAIRAAIGLASGTALLIVCELRVARNYRFTANAMDGAGIAILYATLFAMHQQWRLIPATVAFLGMILVTAAAVFLSTRRDSVFIALLGLTGGFATPALLSSDENRPIALFSYLLLLNGGISWIAYRKRWPLLTALSIALTAIYQWSWIDRYLTTGQLPLAAAIFVLFALLGASALLDTEADDRRQVFRRIAAAAAILPLIFAFFTAIVPEYGAQYYVLFGFLLLIATGLAAIALWRGPEWLHAVGGMAVIATFFIWLAVSYTKESWPWSMVWLAAFVALYLAAGLRLQSKTTYTAALLFFVFIGLATRESAHDAALTGALLALLVPVIVFALRFAKPALAALALALSSIAVMVIDAPLQIALPAHAALFAALMLVAWISERHLLVVLAVPFFIAASVANEPSGAARQLLFGSALYALFIAYALLLGPRAKRAVAPFAAASLASVVFYFEAIDILGRLGYANITGIVPLAQSALMLAVLWRLRSAERIESRVMLVAASALLFLTIAIPEQFQHEWTAILWSLEVLGLTWLYTRVRHRGLLAWSGGVALIVLLQLLTDNDVYLVRGAYFAAVACMFGAAWLAPRAESVFRGVVSAAGTIALFARLNIEIADYYSPADRLTFNFLSSSLAQDLTYTMCWAAFAIAMLVIGLMLHARGARVAALGLLLVTVLKCFLHDLARLGGLYRVGSLFGLAVSLVLVGLLLQKFVMLAAKPSESGPAPNGTT